MTGKYRGTGQYYLVFNELANAARYRGTVTYQELAHVVGLPITGSNMGTELGKLLGEISEDETSKFGHPMLSAIAVDVNGEPGEGFYTLAKNLGRFNGGENKEERRQFWEAEKKAVHERWGKKF